MSGAAGQAAPPRFRWARRLARGAAVAVVLAAVALGALAWRLAEAPLEVPPLARLIEREADARLAAQGLRLEVGGAAVAWEGWRGGAAAPLDIRLSDVRVREVEPGADAMRLPDATVALSARALLLGGRLAPATVNLRRPSLVLTREPDGSVRLGAADAPRPRAPPAAGTGPEAAAVGGDAPAEEDGAPLAWLLAALLGSPRGAAEGGGGDPAAAALADLRRVRLVGGRAVVVDRALGRRWVLDGVALDVRRLPAGGLSAEGAATVHTGDLSVPVRLSATAAGAPVRVSATAVLPALRPAALAALWPELGPLRALDAAVSLSATAELGAEGRLERLRARLAAGAGALALGPGGARLPFAGFDAALEGGGRSLRLTEATLRLSPSDGGAPGPVLHATGEARRDPAEGDWAAALDVRLDPLALPALVRAWPEALAPEARRGAVAARPGGRLAAASLRVALRAAEGFEAVRLVEARAALLAEAVALDLAAAGAAMGLSRAPTAAGAAGRGAAAAASDSPAVVADRVEFAAVLTPASLRLERLALRLPAPGDGAAGGPTLAAEGEATRAADGAGGWRGAVSLALDPLRVADLPRLWPEGLRPREREWITRNLTAGELRGGRWRIEGEMPGGADTLRVASLTGSVEATDATVHWLRPVPPLVGVAGTATFSLAEIVVRTRGGRQSGPDGGGGTRGALEAREGTVRFFNFETDPGNAEIAAQVAGPLPDVLALLRHPRLRLFERRPLELGAVAGTADARLTVAFPLLAALPVEQVRIRAAGRVADARLTDVVMGKELERGNLEFSVDTEGLKVSGQGAMEGAPLRVSAEMDFRAGSPAQVTERAAVTVPRADARQVAAFGLDTAGLMEGTAAVEARYERRRSGQGSVALRADLRDARLRLDAVGWQKAAGAPGSAEATLRLAGEALTAVEGLRVEAAGAALRGRAGFGPGARLEVLEIAEGSAFQGSRFGGEVRRPERAGGPWRVTLRGPVLDLRPVLSPPPGAGRARRDPAADAAAGGPEFFVDLRFDRATAGEGRALHGVIAIAELDGRGTPREVRAGGRTGARPGVGAFDVALTPRGGRGERDLRITAEDGGALLRALDLTDAIQGGRMTVTATYTDARPGAPLTGTAELDGFVLRDAPAIAKVLQAATLYGVVEAIQGGTGLVFAKLVAPFTLTPEAVVLTDARAFSASLGVTAKGRIWRESERVEVEGTVVPAYVFNQLLGSIPIIGRIFSPERGGGVFAATYRVQGPLSDPSVSVNPLAALTPGFLRGIFGLAERGRQ